MHYMNVEQFSGNAHIIYHTKLRERKEVTSGRPGCIYSCWKTAFMQHVAPPFLRPTNPALDLLSTGGRYQERGGEKQERISISATSTLPHSYMRCLREKNIYSQIYKSSFMSHVSKIYVHEVPLQILIKLQITIISMFLFTS